MKLEFAYVYIADSASSQSGLLKKTKEINHADVSVLDFIVRGILQMEYFYKG